MDNSVWINIVILIFTSLICLYLGYRIGYVSKECELIDESTCDLEGSDVSKT